MITHCPVRLVSWSSAATADAAAPMPAAPRRLRLPVPTHIITGALASGKTTALGGLLRLKPQGEVWAVLVNEFGAAGLDAALLEGSTAAARSEEGAAEAGGDGIEGVHIKQLGGGCLCCALSNVTHLAIAQLLRATKPDRCGRRAAHACKHRPRHSAASAPPHSTVPAPPLAAGCSLNPQGWHTRWPCWTCCKGSTWAALWRCSPLCAW